MNHLTAFEASALVLAVAAICLFVIAWRRLGTATKPRRQRQSTALFQRSVAVAGISLLAYAALTVGSSPGNQLGIALILFAGWAVVLIIFGSRRKLPSSL